MLPLPEREMVRMTSPSPQGRGNAAFYDSISFDCGKEKTLPKVKINSALLGYPLNREQIPTLSQVRDLLQRQHLVDLRELTSGEVTEVYSAGPRSARAVPAIPSHRMPAGWFLSSYQRFD